MLKSIVVTEFLQRVSTACYAERCISYDRVCLSDRLSISGWYDSSYHPLISAPLLRMFPLKVHGKVYLTECTVMEDHMIIVYVILTQCQRATDGQTDLS